MLNLKGNSEKLINDLTDKKEYVVDLRLLKFYL